MAGDFTTQLVSDLNKLRGYSAALQNLLRGAFFDGPAEQQATDPSRTVTVGVDSAGVPTQIAVATDWRQRIAAAELAGAIASAHRAALRRRLLLWEQHAVASGWQQDLAEFQQELADGVVPQAAAPAYTPPAPAGPVRPMSELTDDVVALLDTLPRDTDRSATEHEAPVDASVARGRLELSYRTTTGLTASVDAGWAENQSAATLMTYLDQAVQILRLRALRQVRADQPAAGRLDHLLAEAMAHLQTAAS